MFYAKAFVGLYPAAVPEKLVYKAINPDSVFPLKNILLIANKLPGIVWEFFAESYRLFRIFNFNVIKLGFHNKLPSCKKQYTTLKISFQSKKYLRDKGVRFI